MSDCEVYVVTKGGWLLSSLCSHQAICVLLVICQLVEGIHQCDKCVQSSAIK